MKYIICRAENVLFITRQSFSSRLQIYFYPVSLNSLDKQHLKVR